MRRFLFLAALLCAFAASPARADPVLTPLLATAAVTGTIEVAGVGIPLATLVAYTVTTGAAHGSMAVWP